MSEVYKNRIEISKLNDTCVINEINMLNEINKSNNEIHILNAKLKDNRSEIDSLINEVKMLRREIEDVKESEEELIKKNNKLRCDFTLFKVKMLFEMILFQREILKVNRNLGYLTSR